MMFTMGSFVLSAADVRRQDTPKPDTLRHVHATEVRDFRRGPLMSSPLPVSIRQQGRQLCVTSRYNQLLPVYSANGTYYQAFRIIKGTNWLTGLPKGAYIINNQRYVIN